MGVRSKLDMLISFNSRKKHPHRHTYFILHHVMSACPIRITIWQDQEPGSRFIQRVGPMEQQILMRALRPMHDTARAA